LLIDFLELKVCNWLWSQPSSFWSNYATREKLKKAEYDRKGLKSNAFQINAW